MAEDDDQITRRRFLATTAAGTAGLAVGCGGVSNVDGGALPDADRNADGGLDGGLDDGGGGDAGPDASVIQVSEVTY